MTHLSADELIDAMEGVLSAERASHLASCDECRRHLDDLADALVDAKQVSTPEPSPLFWNRFSSRVSAAIDAEAAGGWPQWLRWQGLLPLAATAMIVVALMYAVPRERAGEMMAGTTAAAPDEAAEPGDADSWMLLANLVGELDLETASAAGVIEPGLAEQAVLQLTAEEQQELTRLLEAELAQVKS